MEYSKLVVGLDDFCGELRPYNTHCHHLPDGQHPSLGLTGLIKNSYVAWYHQPVPEEREGSERFFSGLRGGSYLHWLEASLKALYGIDEALSEKSWDRFDAAIRRAHTSPGHHLTLLQSACGYERVVNDSYWEPGSDEGHKGFFTPALRVNMFFFGYSREAQDHNGHNPFEYNGWDAGMSFSDYIDAVEALVRKKASEGCVALKSALAYDRGLDFQQTTHTEASRAYMNPRATAQDIKSFQDFLFYRLCALAAQLKLVFQNHTGLGRLRSSSALHLRQAIEDHPETHFSLFHGSYPWTGDLAGLIHHSPNVSADLCWLPLISPSVCARLLEELVEAGGIRRILWGCDTWTGEESFGALLAFRSVLASVFAGLVSKGVLSLREARDGIRRILSDNARDAFAQTGT